jgi:predicted nucleic acid-binding protein
MSSAILTSPPISAARLVVDRDVASFIFKWHPEFASRYVAAVRGAELIVSFMTLAEMRQGALDANWGPRKCAVLEAYLADFSVFHLDSLLCSTWAAVRNESAQKGRPISYVRTPGLQLQRWGSRRLWLRIIPRTTATSKISDSFLRLSSNLLAPGKISCRHDIPIVVAQCLPIAGANSPSHKQLKIVG